MGKAILTRANDERAIASQLTILMVPVALLKTLGIQGEHEDITPGEVLDKAVKAYLETHGCDDAVSYLWSLSAGAS